MKTLIYYSNTPDGVVSALITASVLRKSNNEYKLLKYEGAIEMQDTPYYFLDFIPDKSILSKVEKNSIWIDNSSSLSQNQGNINILGTRNPSRLSSELTFRFFEGAMKTLPKIVQLLYGNDSNSVALNLICSTFPVEFLDDSRLVEDKTLTEFIQSVGSVLLSNEEFECQKLQKSLFESKVFGLDLECINSPVKYGLQSDEKKDGIMFFRFVNNSEIELILKLKDDKYPVDDSIKFEEAQGNFIARIPILDFIDRMKFIS